MEICSADLRLLCRGATGQQQTSKHNLMYGTSVSMYALIFSCMCIWRAFVSVSICMCGKGGEERGMEMEQMDEGRSAKEDYATSNHHRSHKISPPTLLLRLQGQCRAGII